MKIKRCFFTISFALALGTVIQAAHQEWSTTVGEYQIFLTAVATTQDPHALWQPEMEHQIFCEEKEGQKIYRIVEGHDKEPMQQMTQSDEMRYQNWQANHAPDEKEDPIAAALSTESAVYDLEEEERLSPLMFGYSWGEKEKEVHQDEGSMEAEGRRVSEWSGGDSVATASCREAHPLERSSNQRPPATWIEKMKGFCFQVFNFVRRFFCCFRREEQTPIYSASRHEQRVNQQPVSALATVYNAIFKTPQQVFEDEIITALESDSVILSNLVRLKERLYSWDNRTQPIPKKRELSLALVTKIREKLYNKAQEMLESDYGQAHKNSYVKDLIELRNLIALHGGENTEVARHFYTTEINEKIKIIRAQRSSIKISSSQKLIPWLDGLGFSVIKAVRLGVGGFGTVYPVTDRGFQKDLVYKEEKKINWATETYGPGQIHREGNLITALGELPHMVKIVALIVKVKKAITEEEDLLYLPSECVKIFLTQLKNPGVNGIVDFALVAQLMEKAPGDEVQQTINSSEWKGRNLQERLAYFDAIIPPIMEYYKKAMTYNFVHRDIKCANLFFDFKEKKLTILDPGMSVQLDQQETISQKFRQTFSQQEEPKITTSTKMMGTMRYIAPAVLQEQAYGAEIDAYAFGKVLLDIIDITSCDLIWRTQMHNEQMRNEKTNVKRYDGLFIKNVENCLNFLPSEGSLLREFLSSSDILMQYRKQLISAFLELGSSRPGNFFTNSAYYKGRLQTAYQNYCDAYQKVHNPTPVTESPSDRFLYGNGSYLPSFLRGSPLSLGKR